MKLTNRKQAVRRNAPGKRCALHFMALCLAVAMLMTATQPFAMTAKASQNLQLYNYHWENTPCGIFLYYSTSDFTRSEREAIRAAAQEWNAVRDPDGRSIVSMYLTSFNDPEDPYATTDPTDPEYVHGKIKYEYVPHKNYVGQTDHQASDDGELHRVIITLNTRYNFSVGGSSTTFDIQTIVQHELGHALGVAHCHEEGATNCRSATCADNVMRRNVDPGEVRTELQPYDTASYIRIYW